MTSWHVDQCVAPHVFFTSRQPHLVAADHRLATEKVLHGGYENNAMGPYLRRLLRGGTKRGHRDQPDWACCSIHQCDTGIQDLLHWPSHQLPYHQSSPPIAHGTTQLTARGVTC